MPTKFGLDDVFISADGGMSYTRLGKVTDVELTPNDDALDSALYGFFGLSGEFTLTKECFYRLAGFTNNFLRLHGRRAIRWRQMKKERF